MRILRLIFLPLLTLILFHSPELFPKNLSDSAFFPLSVGNQWIYNIKYSHREYVSDNAILNNKVYYNIKNSRYVRPDFWVREEDSVIYFFDTSSHKEYKLFDFKAKTGSSWSIPKIKPFGYECTLGDSIRLISANETITTEAGTFKNCYHFRHISFCMDAGLVDTWFCKAVGIVKFTEESFGGRLTYNLDKYSFTALPKSLMRDWKTAIDTTWGEGQSASYKLMVFDSLWNTIDQKFACFQNLEIDWNALRDKYRPEVEKGVSAGRFAAILNHMGLRLQETHTNIYDVLVNYNFVFDPPPGTPLLYTGIWGVDAHFGAGLTPMPDSSLLVYDVKENHPLGLRPGDIVLGYDGIPWKILYKELLRLELPINATSLWGANDKAFTHQWLSGAGENWHLFDTIDIKKFGSGEIIHLPTSLLHGKKFDINCSEQLPVPGVPWIDKSNQWSVAWGVVEGTKVGYVYVWNWSEGISDKFYNALDSLISIFKIDGLILDFRANNGGSVEHSDPGLRLLFKNSAPTMGLGYRSNPLYHFQMKNSFGYVFSDDSSRYFDKPIAVLTGPMSISASDFIVKRLQYHPRVRTFGSPTSSAFSSAQRVQISNFIMNYAYMNGVEKDRPDEYLTHSRTKVDEEVWFTPEDVSRKEDTIVKEALKWINNYLVSVSNSISYVPASFDLKQNYPNPFNPSTTLSYSIPIPSHVELKVYDVLGREISSLVNKEQTAGEYKVQFSASSLPSGIYVYTIHAGEFTASRKFLLLK